MGVDAERGLKPDASPEAWTRRRAANDQQTEHGSRIDNATRRPPSVRRPAERKLDHEQECKKGEMFTITSRSFPRSGGCYQPQNEYNGEAMYSPSRENRSNGYVVGATPDVTGDPHDIRWSLIYADSGNTKESFSLCRSVRSAATIHPADAIWFCDLSGNGVHTIVSRNDFSVSCGCSSSDSAYTSARHVQSPPPLMSREFRSGIIFVFGVISLCSLYLKLIGGRQTCLQWVSKCVRIGSTEDPL